MKTHLSVALWYVCIHSSTLHTKVLCGNNTTVIWGSVGVWLSLGPVLGCLCASLLTFRILISLENKQLSSYVTCSDTHSHPVTCQCRFTVSLQVFSFVWLFKTCIHMPWIITVCVISDHTLICLFFSTTSEKRSSRRNMRVFSWKRRCNTQQKQLTSLHWEKRKWIGSATQLKRKWGWERLWREFSRAYKSGGEKGLVSKVCTLIQKG